MKKMLPAIAIVSLLVTSTPLYAADVPKSCIDRKKVKRLKDPENKISAEIVEKSKGRPTSTKYMHYKKVLIYDYPTSNIGYFLQSDTNGRTLVVQLVGSPDFVGALTLQTERGEIVLSSTAISLKVRCSSVPAAGGMSWKQCVSDHFTNFEMSPDDFNAIADSSREFLLTRATGRDGIDYACPIPIYPKEFRAFRKALENSVSR